MVKNSGYSIDQSPLFRLSSKKKLAGLLGVSVKYLHSILTLDNYRIWEAPQKYQDILAGFPPPSKTRKIQEPKQLLLRLHKKLSIFLSRIKKPDFVYSATKGRSYVDNAREHMNFGRAIKIDIKDFYPSVRRKLVRDFFINDMQCAPDIAYVLSLLCCVKDSLPTGSPLSPVLSYLLALAYFVRSHIWQR